MSQLLQYQKIATPTLTQIIDEQTTESETLPLINFRKCERIIREVREMYPQMVLTRQHTKKLMASSS